MISCRNRTVRPRETVIDLVFTKNGCRKTITHMSESRAAVRSAAESLQPRPRFAGHIRSPSDTASRRGPSTNGSFFGCPTAIIAQVTEHLFGVGRLHLPQHQLPPLSCRLTTLRPRRALLQAILKSDFVHVDETKISIQGVDHYVWVFTDGKHVVFRMTETREADIVREVLAGYKGVLVSDFYPGYDGDPVPATEVPRPPHPRHQRRPLEGPVRQGTGGVRRGGPVPARADPGGG